MTCFRLVHGCCGWLAASPASANVVMTAAGGASRPLLSLYKVMIIRLFIMFNQEHKRHGDSGSAVTFTSMNWPGATQSLWPEHLLSTGAYKVHLTTNVLARGFDCSVHRCECARKGRHRCLSYATICLCHTSHPSAHVREQSMLLQSLCISHCRFCRLTCQVHQHCQLTGRPSHLAVAVACCAPPSLQLAVARIRRCHACTPRLHCCCRSAIQESRRRKNQHLVDLD